MQHEHLSPGDCVTLKSGCGPTMCVTKVENAEGDATVSTVWFTTEGIKQAGSFPMVVLECHHDEPEPHKKAKK